MLTYTAFTHLDARRQLDVVGSAGTCLAEAGHHDWYSLYYQLAQFYVEVRVMHWPDPGVRVETFTRSDPRFDGLVDLLPVELNSLIAASA